MAWIFIAAAVAIAVGGAVVFKNWDKWNGNPYESTSFLAFLTMIGSFFISGVIFVVGGGVILGPHLIETKWHETTYKIAAVQDGKYIRPINKEGRDYLEYKVDYGPYRKRQSVMESEHEFEFRTGDPSLVVREPYSDSIWSLIGAGTDIYIFTIPPAK